MPGGRRGRPVDPGSLTQRILAFLSDDQWYDTREISLATGASMRRVGDILSYLQNQGIVENANFPPMMGVWHISDDL